MTDARNRILEAADDLFGEVGFDATTTREIAERSGVNKALIHYHFKGKEALLASVFDRYYGDLGRNRNFSRIVQREASGGRHMDRLRERTLPIFTMGMESAWEAFPAARKGDLSAEHLFLSFYGMIVTTFTYADLLAGLIGSEPLGEAALAARKAHLHRMVDLVLAGSASSFPFGSLSAPGGEDGPLAPEYRGIAYIESKHMAMGLVDDHVERRDLDAVTVAPTFMLGAYDARPSSGELICQFLDRRPRVAPEGGRNFVYALDVARAIVAALTRGRPGAHYIAAGENLTYRAFFTRVALRAGVAPPRFAIPRAAVLAGGAAGTIAEKVLGRPMRLTLVTARLACLETYYRSTRADAELGMTHTPIEVAIDEALRGLRAFGHIAS